MTTYSVNHTDKNITPITVEKTEVNDTALDVSLFGRINLEYGEDLNENLLNILENFACPEDLSLPTDYKNAVPNLSQTSKTQLHNPTTGQFWYNSSRKSMYFYNGTAWTPIPSRNSYAANWGQIMDGEQIPAPFNAELGYAFNYEDCIWSVSPAVLYPRPDVMACTTYGDAFVRMQYAGAEHGNLISGIANYLIIGIKGNVNNTFDVNDPCTTAPVAVTPTPTPAVTISVTPSATVSPTPTSSAIPPTATNTPTPSTTNTPTPTISNTPIPPTPGVSHTPQPTPAVTPTRTGTPAGTPASTPASTPAVTPTRTGTPAGTPASTPAVTVTPTPTVSPSGLPPLPFCPCPTMYQPDGHVGFVYNSVGPYSTYAAALAAKAPDQEIWSNGVSCYWLLPINQGAWVHVDMCSQM